MRWLGNGEWWGVLRARLKYTYLGEDENKKKKLFSSVCKECQNDWIMNYATRENWNKEKWKREKKKIYYVYYTKVKNLDTTVFKTININYNLKSTLVESFLLFFNILSVYLPLLTFANMNENKSESFFQNVMNLFLLYSFYGFYLNHLQGGREK